MVAERSVTLERFVVTQIEKIRSDYVDMSSDKQCEKHCRLQFKVSKGRLIRLGKINRSLRKITKVLFDE